MEPVAAHSPRAPVRRHRIGGCEVRDVRVEPGVDAHDLGAVDTGTGGVEQRQRGWDMERCQLNRGVELVTYRIVDERRMPDGRPTVHQPVGNRVDVARTSREIAQRGYRISVSVGLLLILDRVVVIDHAQLQTARARIHGEDAHRSLRRGGSRPVRAQPGHRQSRISGMSSKCSRMYSWWRRS